MAPLAVANTSKMTGNRGVSYTEQDAFDALYQELEKGIQSMKNGDFYIIEEAWKEIDKI